MLLVLKLLLSVDYSLRQADKKQYCQHCKYYKYC